MRRGTVITLCASAAFGVLAIVVARGFIDNAVSTQYKQSQKQKAANIAIAPMPVPKIDTVSVMVTDIDLMPGDTLTEQSVNIVEFPASSVPNGSYASYEDLFIDPNNPSVALTKMTQGEPVLAFKISAPGGRASLSASLAENMRAVSIRVNDVTGVAGFVQPEDRVDIILTREIDPTNIGRFGKKSGEAEHKPVFTAEILLQNIKVLGTDQTTHTDTGNAKPNAKLVKTITLEVSALETQKLALATSVGTLSLSLRATGTSEIVSAKSMKVSDFLGPKSKARRAIHKAPTTQPAQVVVVRDGQPHLVKVYREQAKPQDIAELQNLAGGAQ